MPPTVQLAARSFLFVGGTVQNGCPGGVQNLPSEKQGGGHHNKTACTVSIENVCMLIR
jgi:hypothetical protein